MNVEYTKEFLDGPMAGMKLPDFKKCNIAKFKMMKVAETTGAVLKSERENIRYKISNVRRVR